MMGIAKNYQPKKKHKQSTQSKKAYKPKPPYAAVEGMESPAYEKLSPHAVWVLLEFYRKFNGFNRNNLAVSYKEVKYKLAPATFNKSIWELLGFGFLDTVRFGRLERNNSIYALSSRWKRLSNCLEKLDWIEKLLTRAEKVKRVKTPKNLNDEEKSSFRFKRKQLLWKLRRMVFKGNGG
jgi:hypothetical protein